MFFASREVHHRISAAILVGPQLQRFDCFFNTRSDGGVPDIAFIFTTKLRPLIHRSLIGMIDVGRINRSAKKKKKNKKLAEPKKKQKKKKKVSAKHLLEYFSLGVLVRSFPPDVFAAGSIRCC